MKRTIYKWGRYYFQYSPLWETITTNNNRTVDENVKQIINLNHRLLLGYEVLYGKTKQNLVVQQELRYYEEIRQKVKECLKQPRLLEQMLSEEDSLGQGKMGQNVREIHVNLKKALFSNLKLTDSNHPNHTYYQINQLSRRLFINQFINSIPSDYPSLNNDNKTQLSLNLIQIFLNFFNLQLSKINKKYDKTLEEELFALGEISEKGKGQQNQSKGREVDEEEVMDWVSGMVFETDGYKMVKQYLMGNLRQMSKNSRGVCSESQIKGFKYYDRLFRVFSTFKNVRKSLSSLSQIPSLISQQNKQRLDQLIIHEQSQMQVKQDYSEHYDQMNIQSEKLNVLLRVNSQSIYFKAGRQSGQGGGRWKRNNMTMTTMDRMVKKENRLLRDMLREMQKNSTGYYFRGEFYLWKLKRLTDELIVMSKVKQTESQIIQLVNQVVHTLSQLQRTSFPHTKTNNSNYQELKHSELIFFDFICHRIMSNQMDIKSNVLGREQSALNVYRDLIKVTLRLKEKAKSVLLGKSPQRYSMSHNSQNYKEILRLFANLFDNFGLTLPQIIQHQGNQQYNITIENILEKLLMSIVNHKPSIVIFLEEDQKKMLLRLLEGGVLIKGNGKNLEEIVNKLKS